MPTRNEGEKNATDCLFCMTNPANVIFSPCNHLCFCEDCFAKVKIDVASKGDDSEISCPVCREHVDD
jgi:hypothetical protein